MHLTTVGQTTSQQDNFTLINLTTKIKLAKFLKHNANLIYNTCNFFR